MVKNNMKKEIEQRVKDELLFRCNCGGDHFISFRHWEWKDELDEFSIAIIQQGDTLWDRIKKAIKFIIKGGDLYCMDINLNEKDLDKVVTLINKYKND